MTSTRFMNGAKSFFLPLSVPSRATYLYNNQLETIVIAKTMAHLNPKLQHTSLWTSTYFQTFPRCRYHVHQHFHSTTFSARQRKRALPLCRKQHSSFHDPKSQPARSQYSCNGGCHRYYPSNQFLEQKQLCSSSPYKSH